jgi:hypothetical protein
VQIRAPGNFTWKLYHTLPKKEKPNGTQKMVPEKKLSQAFMAG